MPEDIPEELEFSPEMEVPKITDRNPKKPDFGMFIGIVGVLLAVLIPILQMNGVEINWEWSAIAYTAIITGSIWTYLVHAVPHRGKIIRLFGSFLILIGLGTLSTFATHRQYILQHYKPPIVDMSPKFEVRINDFTNPIVNGSVAPISKGVGTAFWVFNSGKTSAKNIRIQIATPLNFSNVDSTTWIPEPSMRTGNDFSEVEGESNWEIVDTEGDLQGNKRNAFGTPLFTILKNVSIPRVDRKSLEKWDFMILDTNAPSNFLIPDSYLPFELIISADDNVFEKRVFFLNVTNNYAP